MTIVPTPTLEDHVMYDKVLLNVTAFEGVSFTEDFGDGILPNGISIVSKSPRIKMALKQYCKALQKLLCSEQ